MTLGFCAPPAHRPSMALLLLFVALLAATPAHAFSNVEWQKQAVFQIVTDRFAAPQTMPLLRDEPCSDLRNYCGGTWSGMQQKLSYIQGLNLNSLWISPPLQQSLGGYHGQVELASHAVGHAKCCCWLRAVAPKTPDTVMFDPPVPAVTGPLICMQPTLPLAPRTSSKTSCSSCRRRASRSYWMLS